MEPMPISKLSFAAKVVPAGRIFLRRLIDHSYIITFTCQLVPELIFSGGMSVFQESVSCSKMTGKKQLTYH